MGIVIDILLGLSALFALISGKGKEKSLVFVPIGIYLLVPTIESIIWGFISGSYDLRTLDKSPLYLIFTIINVVIFIGTAFFVVRKIQNNKLNRIKEEIDKS